jgi:hypothetical protein
VQVHLWSISVPNFTRLASVVRKESWNGKMKKLFFAKPPYCYFILYECVTQIQAACLSQLSRSILFRGPKEVPLVSPRLKFSASAMLLCIAIHQTIHRQMSTKSSTSKVGLDTRARVMLISSRSTFLPLYE